ncbi:methyl-accepting chemotaxis protein [Herbaspirillum rubrisubalbicans]|uniref:methyl-accepting chemotaxis protein n=1 Tax=Herbaspirillum rubrisubalbicans TaxID=80842 RepID=UPI00209D8EAB|nr:methyl-accepting chemotaxis protein [Herbaspirillum rubrisubalbicans]MCP1576802.1 methyl-accepting chemotaxis protein [Herbaspirillum rubrisubalbicans]
MLGITKLSIGARLYGVSGLLIAALSALAITSWVQLSQVNQLAHRVGEVRVTQLALIASTELNLTRVMVDLRQALLVKDAAQIRAALADVDAMRKQITDNDNAYLKDVPTQEGRDAFDRNWLKLQQVTWPVAEANMALIRDGRTDDAMAMLMQKTAPAFAPLQKWLSEERARQGSSVGQEVLDIGNSANLMRMQLTSLVVVIAIGLSLFSWYIGRVLRSRVVQSQQVAQRVKDGDFTVEVRDEARDEFSPLLYTLGEMQTSLTGVVRSVRGNAEYVATASAEISKGNNDLAQRTESQASALEETAASMEELSTTVTQNVDSAREADSLTKAASDIARKGGEVVSEVVQTMRNINDSSKHIADIIGVIDGIAFQTNILALNAAVEAARAGEQGRGFAVVASEVRSLAGRSAEAAKQIKGLITVSVERIEHGTQLVDQAGQTMDEVVASVARVTDIMSRINEASVEQSAGVGQVSEAVTQMDQVTQQNAALVEQTAAAAESLKGQAQQLVNAMSVFKLAQERLTLDLVE